jgi:hypothetical protein
MRNFQLSPLPVFGQLAQTYAPSAVWGGSTTQEVRYAPIPKKKATQLWHKARDFERQTRRAGRQDGALGRNGLAVLHALIFDFLNYTTGRLDPAIATIAQVAGISARSAARGLAKLRAANVVNWLRRCSASMEDGRFTLRQDTNAYAILPSVNWCGYRPPPELVTARPQPWQWGACPPLLAGLKATAEAESWGGRPAVLLELESDPKDQLALALARLGKLAIPKG